MFTVYVVCNGSGVMYVGMSTDFPRRLKQHRKGECPSTNKGCLDWRPLHLWQCPSYLYMSKLERYVQRLRSDLKIRDAIKLFPFFSNNLQEELDKIPTTQQEMEPEWLKTKLQRQSAPKFYGRGNTVAQRKKSRKYHNEVKAQRRRRIVTKAEEFKKYVPDQAALDKLNALNSPNYVSIKSEK